MGDIGENLPSSPESEKDRKEKSGLEALQRKLGAYGKAHARLLEVLSYLKELKHASRDGCADIISPFWLDAYKFQPDQENLGWLIGKLEGCARWLSFRHYKEDDKIRFGNVSMCRKDLLCPFCAMKRGAKFLQDYMPRFAALIKAYPHLIPVLITLTVKNGPDLRERVEHLFVSLTKVKGKRRNAKSGGRCKSELSKIVGEVGAYEITHNPKTGWHPHVHIRAPNLVRAINRQVPRVPPPVPPSP